MLHLDYAVIVEGKYDKITLSSVIDAVIIPTNGFKIFRDKEKLEIIKYYARKNGIIILTDSDSAGFKIRNYLKGTIKDGKIINIYAPDIFGREKRKTSASKEGKLGIEGMTQSLLLELFNNAGVVTSERNSSGNPVTRIDLYETGLTGRENSSMKRKIILKALKLPELLTTAGMLEIINTMMTRDEFMTFAESVLSVRKDS